MTKELTTYEKVVFILLGTLPATIFIIFVIFLIVAMILWIMGLVVGILLSITFLIGLGGILFLIFFLCVLIVDLLLTPFKFLYNKIKSKETSK